MKPLNLTPEQFDSVERIMRTAFDKEKDYDKALDICVACTRMGLPKSFCREMYNDLMFTLPRQFNDIVQLN